MAWVTKDQIRRAREFHVFDYVMRNEINDYKRVGRGYRHKDSNALAVDEKGWYCHIRCTGSKTTLDYLVEIKGCDFVETVCMLLGEEPQERSNKGKTAALSKKAPSKSRPPPDTAKAPAANENGKSHTPTKTAPTEPQPQPLPFALPLRNKTNNRIIAYLQSRGIDKELILACISRGVLFESRHYHNAVFLGKDENGKTKFAAMRSVVNGFMRDADGSEKKYGFILPPDNPDSNGVIIFESPIDCLSHQTLCKQGYLQPVDGWRLSLGGKSPAALEHFLEQNPNVTHCIAATDNDKAGEEIAAKIAEIAATPDISPISGITVERATPTIGKDWNDTLQAVKKAERTQHRARDSPHL